MSNVPMNVTTALSEAGLKQGVKITRVLKPKEIEKHRGQLYNKCVDAILAMNKPIKVDMLYDTVKHMYISEKDFIADFKSRAALDTRVQFKSYKGRNGGYYVSSSSLSIDEYRANAKAQSQSVKGRLAYSALIKYASNVSPQSESDEFKYIPSNIEKYAILDPDVYKGKPAILSIDLDHWKHVDIPTGFSKFDNILFLWKEREGGKYAALSHDGIFVYERIPPHMVGIK